MYYSIYCKADHKSASGDGKRLARTDSGYCNYTCGSHTAHRSRITINRFPPPAKRGNKTKP
jgi:hypothetical protein